MIALKTHFFFFIKVGVKIIIGPFKSGFISKPLKRKEGLLVTFSKMEKLVDDVGLAYVLIVF
jgi:hypothetical protein